MRPEEVDDYIKSLATEVGKQINTVNKQLNHRMSDIESRYVEYNGRRLYVGVGEPITIMGMRPQDVYIDLDTYKIYTNM